MSEPNRFNNPEFLKDLEFITDQLSKTDPSEQPAESPLPFDAMELPDSLFPQLSEEELRLHAELEQVCLDTGATGAAVAFLRGEEMVCHASAGPQAPGIGVHLDPRAGLSGSCMQTRRLQQCSDTETDSRVDAEACRRLGVRSVVALPLLEGDKLFGILEILSSRPNAFSQVHVDSLQPLADRMVERQKQNREPNATVPTQEPEVVRHKAEEKKVVEEVVHRDKLPAAWASKLPRPKQAPKRKDRSTTMLGVLVVASAMLLGMLVGWRLGWEKATLGIRARATSYRTNARPNTSQINLVSVPIKEPRLKSAKADECGQSGASDSHAKNGGLTICQDGRVIFRLPASAARPAQDSPATQGSAAAKGNPALQ